MKPGKKREKKNVRTIILNMLLFNFYVIKLSDWSDFGILNLRTTIFIRETTL